MEGGTVRYSAKHPLLALQQEHAVIGARFLLHCQIWVDSRPSGQLVGRRLRLTRPVRRVANKVQLLAEHQPADDEPGKPQLPVPRTLPAEPERQCRRRAARITAAGDRDRFVVAYAGDVQHDDEHLDLAAEREIHRAQPPPACRGGGGRSR